VKSKETKEKDKRKSKSNGNGTSGGNGKSNGKNDDGGSHDERCGTMVVPMMRDAGLAEEGGGWPVGWRVKSTEWNCGMKRRR
jgi:hypothetical protein